METIQDGEWHGMAFDGTLYESVIRMQLLDYINFINKYLILFCSPSIYPTKLYMNNLFLDKFQWL